MWWKRKETTASQKLINALVDGDVAAMEQLLAQGADPNACDPNSIPALAIAVSSQQTKAAELLLRARANPNLRVTIRTENIQNAPVIQFAAANGSLEIVRSLIQSGANVNVADATGLTPLMSAAFMGHGSVVEYLLSQGADREARDEMGYTALMFAANAGKASVLAILLAAGVDPDGGDKDGSTPIMFAAQHGFDECVRLLIRAGADVTRVGRHGLSAIDFARQNEHKTTEQILASGSAAV